MEDSRCPYEIMLICFLTNNLYPNENTILHVLEIDINPLTPFVSCRIISLETRSVFLGVVDVSLSSLNANRSFTATDSRFCILIANFMDAGSHRNQPHITFDVIKDILPFPCPECFTGCFRLRE